MKSRSPQAMALVIVLLLQLAAGPGSVVYGKAVEQAATASGSNNDTMVTLFSEVAGGLDELGRAPLFRLTFEATAGVGPEDLPTPFVAYVESGSFTHRDASGAYADVESGAVLNAAAGDDYAIRNADLSPSTLLVIALPGSCLQFSDQACGPHFLPYDFLCDAPCRPDVTNTLLFPQQEIMLRLMPVTYSVHKVNLGAGEELAAFDFGGETDSISLLVRIDVGAVQSSSGETYASGDVFAPIPDQTVVAADASGAALIVLRVAEAS